MTYYLATNPVWQTRVREEAIAAFGKPAGDDDLVSNLDKLEGLPILNACLKETLRLQPSAPFGGGRVMNQDLLYEYTDLAGNKKQIDFRKGDAVLPFVYGAQRNQDFWDKRFGPVDEFNPERLVGKAAKTVQPRWCCVDLSSFLAPCQVLARPQRRCKNTMGNESIRKRSSEMCWRAFGVGRSSLDHRGAREALRVANAA